ncbi:amino acid kinase family protein [Aureimonas frigidaquae]|uniref:amino acid kinase family protein n=1 Tax=Aureimonas frigidaquae TaxID=424757 RepID=UPI000A83A5F7|nr:amino acid kinase [Aureimonas frigidaquae]
MKDLLIVKVGGSSISSPDLKVWVGNIEKSSRPLVLVPGGGPFAAVVRRFQPVIGFDNDAAHHMAILAMEQFGRALVSLGERLVAVATREAILREIEAGNIPVWMPAKLALRAGEIPRNWSVTSDSLAAWLAGQFSGCSLCLIKQLDMPEGSTLEAISAAGVVDESFVKLLHPETAVHVAGPADLSMAGKRLAAGAVPGRAIARGSRLHGGMAIEAAE